MVISFKSFCLKLVTVVPNEKKPIKAHFKFSFECFGLAERCSRLTDYANDNVMLLN